VYMRR